MVLTNFMAFLMTESSAEMCFISVDVVGIFRIESFRILHSGQNAVYIVFQRILTMTVSSMGVCCFAINRDNPTACPNSVVFQHLISKSYPVNINAEC